LTTTIATPNIMANAARDEAAADPGFRARRKP
jgi:hypothetical protein